MLATPCAHSAHAFCKALRTRCSPSFLICTAIAAVLAEKLSVDKAIESLLTRPIKAEE